MKTLSRLLALMVVPLLFLLPYVFDGCASSGPVDEMSFYEMRSSEAVRRGLKAFERGDLKIAETMFLKSLKINRSVDNRTGEAFDLVNLGRVYTAMGRFDEAILFLREALALSNSLNDRRIVSETYATLSKASFMAGDIQNTLKYIEESLKIDSSLGYKDVGPKLNLKALALMEKGRLDEAGLLLQKALRLNKGSGRKVEMANTLRALAELSAGKGEHTKAIEFLNSAYEIDRASGDTTKIAFDLEKMAELHYKDGRLTEAVFLLDRSYKVNLSGGNTARAVADLNNLIKAYTEMGEVEKAEHYSAIREGIIERVRLR